MNEQNLILGLQKYLHEPAMFNKNEDACFFRIPNTSLIIVANLDNLAWKTDIIPEIMNEKDAGSKIVAITSSDLAAKGVQPLFFMSSISFPPNWSEERVLSIADGIRTEAESNNIKYLGGDLGSADQLILTGTTIGVLDEQEKKPLPRNGAQISDIVCVTGFFGYTGLFYQLYFQQQGKELLHTLPKSVIDKVKYPKAKIQVGAILSKKVGVNSCIDSSDGLSISLWELAEQSNCKIIIDNPPIAREIIPWYKKHDISWQKGVFEGGEEFELVFTVKKEGYENLKNLLSKQGEEIHPIGVVQEGKGVFLGSKHLPRGGWDAGLANWASIEKMK
ncbi:MAG: thiamine-phosphate kinase [Promethearchaeota archaeon]